MGGVLRSLWRRPRPNHDVENPLRTSTAPEVDSSSLGARPPVGDLAESESHHVDPSGSKPARACACGPRKLSTLSDRYRYGPPRLLDLTNELKMVNWHRLGRQLDVPPDRLDKIEEDYATSERRLYEVMLYWLNDETDPSWDKICEALRRMGGFARIVRELKIKYCSLSEFFCSSVTCARCNQLHLCKSVYTDDHAENASLHCDVDCDILKTIEKLQRDFRQRVTCIRLSLNNFGTVSEIKELLKELPAGEVKGQVGLLLSNNFTTIMSSHSIDHLFTYLSHIQAWDFLHPQLLEYLVQELGDDDAKRSMEGYKSCLVQFRRTTKLRQLSGWFGRITEASTFQKIVLSLGSDWEEKTYEEFEELRVSLLRQEVFFQSSLHLCGALTGSLFVALVIPKSIDIAVMRQMLREYQLLKFLMDNDISSIYAEQVCLVQDVPTALSHHDAGSKTPQASLATNIVTTASVATGSRSWRRCKSLPLFESKDLPPPSGRNTSGSLPDIKISISQYNLKLEYFEGQQHFVQHSEDLETNLDIPIATYTDNYETLTYPIQESSPSSTSAYSYI